MRDEQKWYDSYRNHFEDKVPTPMAVLYYGPQAGLSKALKSTPVACTVQGRLRAKILA